MRCESYEQFAIVQGDTAKQLTEELNAELRHLKSKHPTVTFEGLIARIAYTEDNVIPETLGDEYALEGVNLRCGACPYFKPFMKSDGTVDKRQKSGECKYANYGKTARDARACDRLFDLLNSGEAKICLKESD